MYKIYKLIQRYWLTTLLSFLLLMLLKQNFIINKLPQVVWQKQQLIEQYTLKNQQLLQQNQILHKNVQKYKQENIEIIESRARYRLGLIKEGEQYYQIIHKNINDYKL